jgi:hypothetical protein
MRCAVELLADFDLSITALPDWLIGVNDENRNIVWVIDVPQADKPPTAGA